MSDSLGLGWERMTWACERVISPSRVSERDETSSVDTGMAFSGKEPKEEGILEM